MAMTPIFLFFVFREIVFHRFSSFLLPVGAAQSDIHLQHKNFTPHVSIVGMFTALLFARRLIPFIYIRLIF